MSVCSETNESSLPTKGIIKETLVSLWTFSPRNLRRARSDFFLSKYALNSLIVENESDQPENMMKLNAWLCTRAVVNHTLEVSLSLIDDENRQCYTVEKRLRNSTSETTRVCYTMNFNITQKFFQNGSLRIQCSICVDNRSESSSLSPSKEDFNKLRALLQEHLGDAEKVGVLTTKDVFTWVISESVMKTKETEVRSEPFRFAFSELFFYKLKGSHAVCLNQTTRVYCKQNIRVTLAVLDNRGIAHYAKEEVTPDASEMLLRYGGVFESRWKFLDEDQLKICCSLQGDLYPARGSSSSEASGNLMPKPSGSSETSKLTTISSATLNVADVENSTFVSSIDKDEIEKAVIEILELLREARIDTMVIVYKKNEIGTSSSLT